MLVEEMPEPTQHQRVPESTFFCSRYDVLALTFALLIFGFLCWRATLPYNRQHSAVDFVVVNTNHKSYYLPRNTNTYDDVVTQVTARNFARDGFLRTHVLPNRSHAPNVSLYDMSLTQCEAIDPPRHVLRYRNGFGLYRDVVSLNNDCIYTHYPPLADWIFGSMARSGFDQVLHYKLLAILVNSAFLLATYAWLRREVRPSAALLASVLTGTFPAFLQWANALYYHSFQYLFLILGVLTWGAYLRQNRRVWFILTWLLYLCESLASFQLTLCFGVMLVGLLLVEHGRRGLSQQCRALSIHAAAPISAFCLHFCLSASLFGFERAFGNLLNTVWNRVSEGHPNGFRNVVDAFESGLMPWILVLVGLVVLIVVRLGARAPLGRPLALLGTFFVGGTSFMVALPGTTTWHGWMMYRQLMPFTVLLMALVIDSLLRWRELSHRSAPHIGAPKLPGWAMRICLVLGALVLGWVSYKNARQVLGEIRWNLVLNRHHDPANLALRSLDVVYWTEGRSKSDGFQYMPVTGLRTHEPPAWNTDFRMGGPAPAHYEIWWLEDVPIRTVQILVDARQAQLVAEHCHVSLFDGAEFRRKPEDTLRVTAPFVPAAGESAPAEPYAWLRFTWPEPQQSRAARFTCGGLDRVTLRQIEAFSI